MMKQRTITVIFFNGLFLMLAGLMLFLPACSSDSEDDVTPDCNLENVTYSGTIAPIMVQYCNSCHSAAAPQAGIVTANHEGLSVVALDGRLLGSVNHDQGFSPMPKNMPKLAECPREQIAVWVNDGAPDN
ncbi:MAG: hypothetical protein EA394_02720 [Bacteroidia bacterium]|nr:MAG: hypothetical protein EA394_02720 [Bacteroidia bacterium]